MGRGADRRHRNREKSDLLFFFLEWKRAFLIQLSAQQALSTFNARAESLTSSPLWRPLTEAKRCVVVVDGFFEWTTHGRANATKQPHFVRRIDGQLLYLAGLYDEFVPSASAVALAADDGEEDDAGERDVVVTTAAFAFTIITMRASREIRFLHGRMPCVLQSDAEIDAWLNPANPFAAVTRYLRAYPAAQLEIFQVSPLVNSPANRGPDVILPAKEHAKNGIAALFRHAEEAHESSSAAAPLSNNDDADLALALLLSAQEQEQEQNAAGTFTSASSGDKRKRVNDDDDDDDGNREDKKRASASAVDPGRGPAGSRSSSVASAPAKKFDFRTFVAAKSNQS
jgi:putative SOS response-associated peptidase YedK